MKTSLGALLMFSWLQLNWFSQGEKVEQHPSTLSVQQGSSSVINCSYSDSASEYFPWYKQELGKGPQLLIDIRSNVAKKEDQRLTVLLNRTAKHLSLHITDTQPEDSAVYFCVASLNTGNRFYFGRGTSLTVVPNIKDPDPAVYQLRGPKSSNISVCLFTDFDSETAVQEPEESTVTIMNTTALDMWAMNSKSNGALAWSDSTDFKCNETFNEEFYSSSDFSCDATLIEKSFETDMNLNFHNLLVIGLRIILLKVVGFNLLMTLRLWSC